MIKTTVYCDMCEKEIKKDRKKLLLLNIGQDGEVETKVNEEADYCKSCMNKITMMIIGLGKKEVPVEEAAAVVTTGKAEKVVKNSEQKEKTEKERAKESEEHKFEMYGKVFALRRSGWTWKKIAGEILHDETDQGASSICTRFNTYCRRHPDAYKRWSGEIEEEATEDGWRDVE